jgi:hypothetical protein
VDRISQQKLPAAEQFPAWLCPAEQEDVQKCPGVFSQGFPAPVGTTGPLYMQQYCPLEHAVPDPFSSSAQLSLQLPPGHVAGCVVVDVEDEPESKGTQL